MLFNVFIVRMKIQVKFRQASTVIEKYQGLRNKSVESESNHYTKVSLPGSNTNLFWAGHVTIFLCQKHVTIFLC